MGARKKSEKEIANEKSQRIMEGVAYWTAFYRCNPHRFVADYLNVKLKLFQKILLYAMMHNIYICYIAARGQGKTWLTSLFAVVRCILYPGTQIVVVSGTLKQANEVLEKIENIFMKSYGWGSDNLKAEIVECKIGQNDSKIVFKNGSYIKTATSTDNSRGKRANILIIDECRLVELNIINTVLRKFLTASRQPGYLNNPKYRHLQEDNKEIYMSSAWFQDHWLFKKCRDYFAKMLNDKKKYFVCCLPYQVSVKEGLLKKSKIEDEMSEYTYDEISHTMEWDALFYGDADGAFFSFDDVSSRRRLKSPMYPPSVMSNKTYKIPDLKDGERRILSVDVALMASKKHNNDASAIIINSAIPTSEGNYVANIVWMENHEGLNADELALVVRRLYKAYKCTDLVIDTAGSGLPVYDKLVQDIIDPETGELYHALSCINDEDMAERCKVLNAPKEIWSIKGSASFNNDICVLLRSGFKTGKINLLVSEIEAENILAKKFRNFGKMEAYEQVCYKMPYVQTSLLVTELTKLEYEVKGANIKIKERSGMRKDRYSSLAYNYWVQCQLELKVLRKHNVSFNIRDYARLNKRPITY